MTIVYPRTIFVGTAEPGTDDEFLAVAKTPDELNEALEGFNDRAVKIARYVLAGTGSLNQDAAYYTEDEKT